MKHEWQMVRIGTFAKPSEASVELIPEETYPLLGMSLEGRGLFLREKKRGEDIGAKRLNEVKAGQFIYSRLFAWKGAFDSVTKKFEGCFVSDEYPTFDIDECKADARFLHYYFNQPHVWKEVEQFCIGVTKASRNRFKEQYFLSFEMPLPPKPEQERIISKIEAVQSRLVDIRAIRMEQEREIANLLFSKYSELIKDAEWKCMNDVAPIVRREAKIDEERSYPEIGIRCFGKGTFHKPAVAGIDVGSKKLFQIKAGDLMFSNVFAWEGGIATAKAEDEGRYGSHRFISCVTNKNKALEEFLCYHFLTPQGLEDINASSPGGAGRNKTLGLDKLMRIMVPLPDLELQREFVSLLHKAKELRVHHEQTKQELAEVLPSLLDKAFTGNL